MTQYYNYRRENVEFFAGLLDNEGEREALDEARERAGLVGKFNDPDVRAARAHIAGGSYADIYVVAPRAAHRRLHESGHFPVQPRGRPSRDFAAVVEGIANLGITRLLVPEGPSGDAALAVGDAGGASRADH